MKSIWINVFSRNRVLVSFDYDSSCEAFSALCTMAAECENADDAGYLYTIELTEDGPGKRLYWGAEADTEIAAERRHQRELVSDYYASR